MMQLMCWEANARVVSLSEIMSWSLEHHAVDRMLVALRLQQVGNKWRYEEPKAAEFFHLQFGSYVLTGFQASAWPGTELIGHPGFVYVLDFDEQVMKIVLRTQSSLAGWQHSENPSLPEDICLFRESASHPTLISRTHDLNAWLISETKPEPQGFKASTLSPARLFPAGKYFCRKYKKRNTDRR